MKREISYGVRLKICFHRHKHLCQLSQYVVFHSLFIHTHTLLEIQHPAHIRIGFSANQFILLSLQLTHTHIHTYSIRNADMFSTISNESTIEMTMVCMCAVDELLKPNDVFIHYIALQSNGFCANLILGVVVVCNFENIYLTLYTPL